MRQPVSRIGRIQRHIGAARLEDCQRPDQQVGPARNAQPDMRAGFDPGSLQRLGQAVGARVERAVTQRFIFEDQGGGIRCAGNLRLKRAVNGMVHVIGFGAEVRIRHDKRAFGLGQGCQISKGPGRGPGFCGLGQRLFQPRGQQVHGGIVQPRGIVMQHQCGVGQFKRQHRACHRCVNAMCHGNLRHGQAAQFRHSTGQIGSKAAFCCQLAQCPFHFCADGLQRCLGIVEGQRHPIRQNPQRVRAGFAQRGIAEGDAGFPRAARLGGKAQRQRGGVRQVERSRQRQRPVPPVRHLLARKPRQRQFGGRHCGKCGVPMRLGAGGATCRARQGGGVRQGRDISDTHQRGKIDARAGKRRNVTQRQHALGGGQLCPIGRHVQHRSGCGGVAGGFDPRVTHAQQLPARPDLGVQHRVAVAAEIQRADLRRQFPGRAREIQQTGGIGPVVAGKVTARARILRHRRQIARSQLSQKRRETVHRRRVTFGVQRKRGLVRCDVEQALLQNVAGVDAVFDQVPGDTVPRFAVQDRPGGRVQARVAW